MNNNNDFSTVYTTLERTRPVELSLHLIREYDDNANEHKIMCDFCLTVEEQQTKPKTSFKLYQSLPTNEFHMLLRSLRYLPTLRKLSLVTVEDGYAFPLAAVARILTGGSIAKLETLSITRGMCWSSSEMEGLCQALRNHPTLRSVSLHEICSNDDNDRHEDDYGSLDSLLYALSTIPHLECVDTSVRRLEDEDEKRITRDGFSMANSHNKASPVPRRRLVASPRAIHTLLETPPLLEEVSLWNWQLTDQHVREGFLPALLPCSSSRADDESSRRNQLRFLSLRQNPGISSAGWDALYQAARDNYSLCHLISDTVAPDTFYLELNQMGRGDFLSSTACYSPSAWCRKLEYFADDPDYLYYWVKEGSPMLISP